MSDRFFAADSVLAGSTSVSIEVVMQVQATDVGNTGLVSATIGASYWRQGGLRVEIVTSDLAAVDSAWSSGGFKEVDGTNMSGLYRLDVPDAAFATGADFVIVTVGAVSTKQNFKQIALPTHAALRETIFSKVVEAEGSYTAQQALSIILAALAGVTTTGGTVLKTPDGAATRIAATINGSNERTAMTITPSA